MKRGLSAVLLLCALGVLASAATAARPLLTAVDGDLDAFEGPQTPLAFQYARGAGTSVIRINILWRHVVQAGPKRPPAPFDPLNPSDKAYDWTVPDSQIRQAVAAGLQPMVTLLAPPRWAETGLPRQDRIGGYRVGSWKPDPAEAGAFAHAVALRYGGSYQGLPRVRYWEIWNEPNLVGFLAPQGEDGNLFSPTLYRNLLNAMAGAIHGVHPDNVVAAGSTAPFSLTTTEGAQVATAPMVFMRAVLCMSAGARPKPTCKDKSTFDAWSHHPFTSGGPTDKAPKKDDASFGDLPAMKRLLDAAYKAHHIRSAKAPSLWVTEMAWDTLPPDSLAVPVNLQARWISEALYRSWKAGVTLFTWFQLWDDLGSSPYQDGLYYRNGESLTYAQPKPSFYSFRFPFVAYRQGKKVSVWGRTPFGRPGKVTVQRMGAKGWQKAGTFKTNRYGIFTGKVRYVKPPKAKPAQSQDAPSYHDLVVSASPTSYWPLDELGGSTASDVTTANDGTYEGGVSLGAPGPVPGATAPTFDGKTGRVRLGTVSNVHTVELWVDTTAKGDEAAFSNRDTSSRYLDFGVLGTMASSYDGYPIYAGQVADGQWHQLVYTYDTSTSTGRIYVDGKLSQLAVWPRLEGGAPASIGYDATVGTHFDGKIGQVSVYPYVLSPEQVSSHFQASGKSLAPDVAPGMMRAFLPGSKTGSLPFSLIRPPDLHVVPFGGGG